MSATDEERQTARSFLWEGQVDTAINTLEATESETIRRFCGYLKRHRDQIPNDRYDQEEGWPIGSGDVESWVKQINQRTKIAGASGKAERIPQVLAQVLSQKEYEGMRSLFLIYIYATIPKIWWMKEICPVTGSVAKTAG